MTLHIVQGNLDEDKDQIERAARHGTRISRWIVPKTTTVGDEVVIRVGHDGFYATAIIASHPKRRTDWPNRYSAALNSLKLIEPSISLATTQREIPELDWTKYPRSITTVSTRVAHQIRTLVSKRINANIKWAKNSKKSTERPTQIVFDVPTDHQLRTWNTLVRLIRYRLQRKSRASVLYGDLAKEIFGARNIGAQSFRTSLHEIHVRTDKYNYMRGSRHPRLNSLVFNEHGEQPGIPAFQEPDFVWDALERSDPDYLYRLGLFLGFQRASGPVTTETRHPGKSLKDGAGPMGGGTRSAAYWDARHSPYVQGISKALHAIGCSRANGAPWNPDILVRLTKSNRLLLIEVKSDSTTHNIITAIGQILCYRNPFKEVIATIAAPGLCGVKREIDGVLTRLGIVKIDLDKNVHEQLEALCR